MLADEIPNSESTSVGNKSQQTQDEDPENYRFRVNVDLVTTDVRVIGPNSSELRANDFIVYDNNIPHEVTFLSYEKLPIAVALLVETIGAEHQYPLLKIAVFTALKNLRQLDQVALFSFKESYRGIKKHSDFTFDRLSIAEKMNDIEPNRGGPDIYDAIYRTARYLREKAPSRRCAIILVSKYITYYTDEDLIRTKSEVLKSGASFFSIQIPRILTWVENPESIKTYTDFHSARLKEIADITGGAMLKVDDSISLQQAFRTAIDNFCKQYTLGFYPSDPGLDGDYHTLDVRLRNPDACPGCSLHTRKGYYTGIRPPLSPTVDVPPPTKDAVEKINELLVQRSILTAGATTQDIPDIPITLETVERTGSDGQLQLDLYLNSDPAEIGFDKADDHYTCNLQIAVFYADKKGKILDYEWKRLDRVFSEEDYLQAMKEGLPYKTTVPIKAEKQITKVVVYDEQSGRIGSKLAIPFIVEKAVREIKDGQSRLHVKLKIDPVGIGLENKGEGLHDYSLKIAAYYPDLEEDFPDSKWKKLEGTFKGAVWDLLPEDIGFQSTFPVETEGRMVKIVVYDEISGKTAGKLIRLPDEEIE